MTMPKLMELDVQGFEAFVLYGAAALRAKKPHYNWK